MGLRVALVHDWLTGMRGGERVLSQLCQMYPTADIYTLLHVKGSTNAQIERMPIHTSLLSKLPGVRRYYRYLLPIMPWVIERFDLRGYDLIISCSHCVAKGIRRDASSVHACYCFTPMRYLWADVGDDARGGIGSMGLRLFKPALKRWDLKSADNVDAFSSISTSIQERIKSCYGRESEVVFPPVETSFFTPEPAIAREDWYLVVSALTPYKRVEHVVRACGRLGRPLKVIGSGPEARNLARVAAEYSHIQLLGWQSDEAVRDHYRRCRAFIMPQEEDFGISPIEAMACGAPVIALARGGARDTVVEGQSGILFSEATVEGLMEGIIKFEACRGGFDLGKLTAHAARFGSEEFVRHFTDFIRRACAAKGKALAC